jgi:AhpD family alkylhydroperoxidase
MQARMRNPVLVLPQILQPLIALSGVRTSLPPSLVELVHLRISQINGCALCIEMHGKALKASGDEGDRSALVVAWRDAPVFTAAERAALALAESATRLADCPEAVPDALWDEAARHYDEEALAALVLQIAMINVWNRLNVTTRQLPGSWGG